MLKKKSLLLCSCLLIIAFFFPKFLLAAEDENALIESCIYGLKDEVLSLINNNDVSIGIKTQQLQQIFERVVNIDWMARFALGNHRNLIKNQEMYGIYFEKYKKYLITTYISKFRDYIGADFTISSISRKGQFFLLKTRVITRSDANQVISIDGMLMCKIDNDTKVIKIYDIIVEGISLISTQRVEFSSIITHSGIVALFDALDKKITK